MKRDHFSKTKHLKSNAVRKTLPSQDDIRVFRKLADLSDLLHLVTFLLVQSVQYLPNVYQLRKS